MVQGPGSEVSSAPPTVFPLIHPLQPGKGMLISRLPESGVLKQETLKYAGQDWEPLLHGITSKNAFWLLLFYVH